MADYNTRLTNVENTLNALIKSLNLQKMYSEADNVAEKKNIGENTFGVAENGNGILDLADLSDENSTALEDIAEMLDDHEQRLEALEGR